MLLKTYLPIYHVTVKIAEKLEVERLGGNKMLLLIVNSCVTLKICMQVRKQQLELGMKQQTGSKSGLEYFKAVYCHPAYLTYMQSTS